MVDALVMLNVEKSKIHAVAEKLAGMEGVAEVYSTCGRYDLVGKIRVLESDALEELVAHRILAVEGITHSETMMVFRVYSRHDLERMFGIGFGSEAVAA